MSDNLALWEKLGKTDPSHTKKFKRSGGFEGTAIKPMWSYKRMTEEFGPCGTGWGIGEPSFQVVPGSNQEVLVYCTVSIWYGEGKTVYGVGGDKVVTHIKANTQYNRPERWESDDEAFKKAFTDAVTNALKMIGVGADVHMGMFDDNKYVNTLQKEFAEETKQAANQQPAKPISSAENKRHLEQIERELIDCRTPRDVTKLLNSWADQAEQEKWSKDYWDEARRRFARRKHELEDDPDGAVSSIQNQFPGATTVNERVLDNPLMAG